MQHSGRAHRETVYFKTERHRDTYPERKSVGVLSSEEVPPGENSNHLFGQFFQVFLYLWPMILLLSTPDLSKVPFQHAKMESSTEAYRKVDTTCYRGDVPPLELPEEPSCAYVVREVSLTSRVNTWSLYLLSKFDSAPPWSYHYLYLGVSIHRKPAQPLSLGLVHLLLH